MKNRFLYWCIAIPLFLVPLLRILMLIHQGMWLVDLAGYSAISKTLFQGINPFPDNVDALNQDGIFHFAAKGLVPITYPGQMPFFSLPGYLWSDALQIGFILLNVVLSYLLIGLTLVRACGYQWRDLFSRGGRQLVFGVCCLCFFSSSSVMNSMRAGQITIILALCLYGMFWCAGGAKPSPGPSRASRLLVNATCVFLFAFMAVTKYSVLTVFAPLLFFKGYRKLCVAAFLLFLLFSLSPAFRGNNLADVYAGYSKAVEIFMQPGQSNHFDSNPMMCHLGFFRLSAANHVLKALVCGMMIWLVARECKNRYMTDTVLLLAFCLTMLVSYHGLHDLLLVFPLLMARLFDFARTRRWKLFGITLLFPLFLDIPGRVILQVSSWLGKIPRVGSIVYLSDNPFHFDYLHVFPLTPIFMLALTAWSFYLYLTVEKPYKFELPAG
ncbi:MAG: hypothetical protein IKQ55_09255 [Kiritimatiellae bacterium]|nr:hypothetical protein [Kiritimatiellia bacterium]